MRVAIVAIDLPDDIEDTQQAIDFLSDELSGCSTNWSLVNVEPLELDWAVVEEGD